MNARILVIPWVLAALLALGACSSMAPSTAADFMLIDQHGQSVRLASFRDTPVILTFLYTHCTDTCPLYLFNIREALAGLAPADVVVVMVVTVDPERDTVERLREVTSSWPAGWYYLTGPRSEVAQVWKNYGVLVEKELASNHAVAGHGYGVIHTAKLVLIAPGGQIAREFMGQWRAEDVAAALQAMHADLPASPKGGLAGSLLGFLGRCGEFAANRPWLFLGLVLVIMAPGLALPVYLLHTFLGSSAQTSKASANPGPKS
jgi:protein SCO1/2